MTIASAALDLAARGFRVHPLRPGSKIPLLDGWPQKATNDPRQVREWWEKWAEANVGIATGLGLVVVDLDGDEGSRSWADLARDIDIPPTMAVKTPRGWHLYFAADNVANSANRLGPHVDVRGDGGYVVGPGSVVDGKEYVEHQGSIAQAPAEIIERARGDVIRASTTAIPNAYTPAETYGEGERNDGLFRLASSLRARGLEAPEILAALQVANRERCIPPLDDAEVRLIVSSASRFEKGEPPATIIHRGSATRSTPPTEDDEDAVILTPAGDIDMQPVEMVWDGRIPRGMISLLVGEAGEGKSTLTHYLAAQLSRGTLPGCYEGKPVNVAIASAEDVWSATIAPRLLALDADMSRVMRVETPDHDDISLDGYADKVRAAFGRHEIGLLIVDTIVAHITTARDTYKEQHVREVLKPWKRLCEDTGLTLLGVMHLNRRESRETLTRIAGSGGFGGKARSVLLFARDPEDDDDSPTRYVAHAKCNVAAKAATLRLRIVSAIVGSRHMPTSTLSVEGDAPDMTPDRLLAGRKPEEERSKIEEAMEVIREQLAGGRRVGADEIEKAARGISHATVWNAARKLGVEKVRDGFQGRVLWTLPIQSDQTDVRPPF